MATEIERKFLLKNEDWRSLGSGKRYLQGYLSMTKEHTVRVRVIGEQGFLTIKGASVGAARPEYEYVIPVQDARQMLDTLCAKPLIEKIRYAIAYEGFIWEVDAFEGENAGLVIAEIELADENQSFPRPDWIDREVTGEVRYFNAMLCKKPYRYWSLSAKRGVRP